MIKIFPFFIFQLFTIIIKNVNSVNHKRIFPINNLNIPISYQYNNYRKFGYIDMKKKKIEERKKNGVDNKIAIKKCPLRNITLKNFVSVTGISIPLFLGSLIIYNKMKNEKKNLNEAEKNIGKYLYKHENNQFIENGFEEDKSFNMYNKINNIYNNFLTYLNFYMNVKKVNTKDNLKNYTILFFHSYNVDKFLRSKHIKTYVDRLKDIYNEINKNGDVNIVYVPLDNKILLNIKHFNNMNWYSVLFTDKKLILKLIKRYNIMNIPTMVLLDKNMNIINDNINYLLLYESKDFPYKDINNFTYVNYLYDKNNNKYNLKELNSDYLFFYFNNDKENKEDIQSLLKIKKKLSEKNIKLDIVFIKDVERKKEDKNNKNTNTSNKKMDIQEKINENDKKKIEDSDDDNISNTTNLNDSESNDKNEKNNYIDDIYYLGSLENNIIYKLLLYDIFDITFKPVGILINKKGKILNKYVNISKKDNEIISFILNNNKSINEQVNEKNYMYKYENINNLSNLNVFAPVFILFSDKLDFDLLNQYNILIEQYNKNRKGKKMNFYFLHNENKKYEAIKKLCSVNNTNEMVILDLFNQKLFKENFNNSNILQEVDGRRVISKENFFNFINKYYDDDLYASTINLSKEL
ncbi:thioredoxin-like protein, putative [Plasmodium gallinaceum]|uniref:Thioredoxin-like protein, putative n=1 Tax=Plasmodium gallinaceum TaxID=5849 RepID=A0A1J1GT90_PLAGA|nr:thioredoxin-like protein, putative [Plasmodium gallinaceum]CRG95706.1 thioredoxin-like protein, putative [Plasmodium gallinaceum]